MVSVVLLIGFIIQWMQPYIVLDDLYDYSVQDSIFKKLSSDTTIVFEKTSQAEIVPKNTYKNKTKKGKVDQLSEQININIALQKELEKLPGIGPATAKNIINFRKINGPFRNLKEITKVKRIGPKTFEKIKPFITLGNSN